MPGTPPKSKLRLPKKTGATGKAPPRKNFFNHLVFFQRSKIKFNEIENLPPKPLKDGDLVKVSENPTGRFKHIGFIRGGNYHAIYGKNKRPHLELLENRFAGSGAPIENLKGLLHPIAIKHGDGKVTNIA